MLITMQPNKNILITGATGFIGRHLMEFLSERPLLNLWGISLHGGEVNGIAVDALDLDDYDSFYQWLKDKPRFDGIFHLASHVPPSFYDLDPEIYFFKNLRIAYNVMLLAERYHAFIVYASSTITNCKPNNWYSFGKYVGELMPGVMGVSVVNLRISAPYGPGQTSKTVINKFVENALLSRDIEIYGSGNRSQNFTYIDDVVSAMWLAHLNPSDAVYDIASDKSYSMNDLAQLILSLIPESKSKIIHSGKPDPQEDYRGIFKIEKTQKELGYKPKFTITDGLMECLKHKKIEMGL